MYATVVEVPTPAEVENKRAKFLCSISHSHPFLILLDSVIWNNFSFKLDIYHTNNYYYNDYCYYESFINSLSAKR